MATPKDITASCQLVSVSITAILSESHGVKKTLSFKDEESSLNSSNIESSEFEEKSKIISLDASSNKINSVNTYTFNTKFCDFKNSKGQKNENFENI